MAGRVSRHWINGGQRPEGWSGRTRTQTGDLETGPRVGRWTREEGQRGASQAGSEEDPMHTQSNTHTWKCSTKGHMSTSVQLISVSPSWLTLCDPMDCSRPGLPVHHQLPEFAQTHVHQVSGTSNHLILCCPLLLLPSVFPSIRVFSNESVLCIRWPKYCRLCW